MNRIVLTILLLGTLLLAACLPSAGEETISTQPTVAVTDTTLPVTPTIATTSPTAESATATPPPAATDTPAVPTATTAAVNVPVSATLEADLGNGLSLYTVPGAQSGSVPTYTITTETPLLVGADSPSVATFNQEVAALVEQQVSEWLAGVQGLTQVYTGYASYLEITYSLTAAGPDWLSLNFFVSAYVDGAAHPYHYTITYTYDLAGNRLLALADLFQPGSAYLETIASYAVAELTAREVLLFPEGATPTEENYRNWNITPEGLLITFDEYMVAPYAAGHQTVTVPYSELAGLINPAGPLAAFIQ